MKPILIFIIITLLSIVSINNLSNSAQLNIETLSSFLFIFFILLPLLVYSVYLIINIENYLTNNKSNTLFFQIIYYLFNIIKIIYGFALISFSIFLIYYDITENWDSWLEALIHIFLIFYFITVGTSIVYQTSIKKILKK